MKKIKFTCPHCEAKLRVPTHLAGVSAPCPKCGATITAPSDLTTAVVEAPVQRRAANAVASPAPQRVRQQVGATAVLEAPVSQVVTAAPAPVPVAQPMSPIVAAVSHPNPVEAKIAAPSRPLPTPIPAARECDAAPVAVPARSMPTPVPAAVEQPPILVQAPVPPVLFVPPAPVSEAALQMEDERSAPPALIEDEATVVVEEQVYEMPPAPEPVSPLAPITQPIRVSPPAGDLPISRDNSSTPGTLPRLDVSLGGQDLAGAATVLFGEGAAHQGRSRLVLPQPGAAVSAGNPGDFLVPPSAPVPAPDAAVLPTPVPVPLTPPPMVERVVHPWMEESVDDFVEETIEETLPEHEEATLEPLEAVESGLPIVALPHYKTIPLPNETAPLSLDELEGEETGAEPWEETAILENDAIFDPEGYLGEPSIDEWHATPDDQIVPPLDLPERLESEMPPPRLAPPIAPPFPADWPEIDTAPVPVPMGRAPFPPTPEEEAELPENPLHEGSFGRLFAQQAPPDQVVPGPLGMVAGQASGNSSEISEPAVESDVLDELFYSNPRESGGKKQFSKMVVVATSTIVGLAIFLIVAVYIVLKAFGMLDPAGSYAEPEGGDPVAETAPGGALALKPKGVIVPSSVPDPGIDDAPAVIDPVAMLREGSAPVDQAGNPPAAAPSDSPAISFDEKVQQRVNGTRGVGGSVIGAPSLDLEQTPPTDFSGVIPPPPTNPPAVDSPPTAPDAAPGIVEAAPLASLTPSATPGVEALPMTAVEAAEPGNAPAATPRSIEPPVTKDPNYNPPASFAAPGPNDGALGKTRDLLDAFLRAPDWATRVNYVYQGDSLRATIEDYHKKWAYKPFGRYSVQLYQMEADVSLGGPYWVFIVSTSDEEEGFPLIVRTENGLLKVDWDIFAEFSDRHFLRFREGTMAPPATFRLIVERFSDYYGSDKDTFTDLNDYYVYQVNPPYGDLNEFSEFAFVKKDSPLAAQLDKLVRLGDEPLAVVIKLDQKTFPHGVKHYVITELLTEGWFR